ncbi:Glycosyl transferase, group 2 family protein [hydrothermal vent metagenome]|uniref:Glycosyl transferase, group 2 family protein n=1 Tax=hydrothermal vent metagenome TaxID=652676 RepID=A0A1W1D035_9ZZZZ
MYFSYIINSFFFLCLQAIYPKLIFKSKKIGNTYYILQSKWFFILLGWVNIKIKITSDTFISPYLIIDYGKGNAHNNRIDLIQIDENTYQGDMVLFKGAKKIYFYPDAPRDTFEIQSFKMRSCSDFLHIYYQYTRIVWKDMMAFKNPYRIHIKSYKKYKKQGFLGMLDAVEEEFRKIQPYGVRRITTKKSRYEQWIKTHEVHKNKNRIEDKLMIRPLISILMPTYNTPIQYLKKALDSVLAQSYSHWELCIADDASSDHKMKEMLVDYSRKYENIKVTFREENGHISKASNTALSMVKGEFIGFLDHDDILAENALFEVVKSINKNVEVKFIYSDEDKIDIRGRRYEPHFKSDWNPDMFYSHNYISHFSVISRELVEAVGGFREGYEGAQDYDLFLRILDTLEDKNIAHIPKILYHWRAIVGSSALDSKEKLYTTEAGLKALRDFFEKKDKKILVQKGKVDNTYKVIYPLPSALPLVSILIPTRNHYDMIFKCVESILSHTMYQNYEILIVDNESNDKETLDYLVQLKKNPKISILSYYKPFNYASLNNFAVKHSKGEFVVLLNNDTEIISHHWLSEMLSHASRPDIGAVGAMLYYDNNTIQHAGTILGIGGVANHTHTGFKRGASGYFSRLITVQNYSAVTAACLMVKKSLYEKVGGMNEVYLAVAFNDVDFCLKLLKEGKRNLWTPFVELYHHESVSRGKEESIEEKQRFQNEVYYMQKNWEDLLAEDRYYNKNLSKHYIDFRLSSDLEINLKDKFEAYAHLEDSKGIEKKLSPIPKSFILCFKELEYVAANDDIRKSIEDKEFHTPLEHFVLYGYNEVKEGNRRIGTRFPFFDEEAYLKHNPILVMEIEEGNFSSGYEHFIYFGYKESIENKRAFVGKYPFAWNKVLKEKVYAYFDAFLYLEINPDVKEGIQKKQFVDAWEHFFLIGIEEIRKGERALHPNIGKQSEHLYAKNNQDIWDNTLYPNITTPFEHFLAYGYEEILAGRRELKPINEYTYTAVLMNILIQKEIARFKYTPLISIVMPVYNVEVRWLKLAIASLDKQWYKNWELCIADDGSTNQETLSYLKSLKHTQIKIFYLEKNLNISGASNMALTLARGEYIGLMDNDDTLSCDALYEMLKVLNTKKVDFIYSDEDKLNAEGKHCDPHFKADYAPDMFLSQNYISHFTVIKKSLIDEVGGWTLGLEGSQDYDLYLKVLELTDKIIHIPKVLYHWRKVEGSTAVNFSDKSYAQEAGQKALANALLRRKIDAKVETGKYTGTYRIKYAIKGNPLISIIIPFKDKPELLKVCIESVLSCSSYQNYEIIALSNNSHEIETFELMKSLSKKDKRVSFYEYNIAFNYAKINNYAVETYAKGEHILLLNNDIEIISKNWIESMLEFSQRENIGAVGAKLYYEDDTIQHAGVSMGVLTLTGHNFRHLPRDATAYMGREGVIQNVSAVTAACLMVKKELYTFVEGMNEESLKIAFNDIDFCLRLREKGYLNLFTPYAELYHYESRTRGYEDTPKKLKRFKTEVEYMQERHIKILEEGDPYYNKNFSLENEDFEVISQ